MASKDPAFLFYSDKFIGGVTTMNFEDRGKYITLLALMHQQGRMDLETISFLIGNFSDKLKAKFDIDENGLYFNKTLEEAVEKRRNFSESRSNNGKKGGRPSDKENLEQSIIKPLASENDNLAINVNINVIKDVILILNEITGSSFKDSSKASQKHILARLNEGYKLEDFRTVVSAKFYEWGNDSKMNKFLRPETLFGNKFEGYLQATKKIVIDGTQPGKQNTYNSVKADVADMVRQTARMLQGDNMHNG